MATSRRGKKPVLTRARPGQAPDDNGSYTVETRERRAPGPPPGPAEGVAGILEALRGAGQIGIYRQQPQWARGHLQTLSLSGGEKVDFDMLDQLQRYWGGGTYQFRPMRAGRFAGSTQSIQFDGPTLYQGKPHPKDPDRASEPVAAEVLPQHAPHYQAPHYQPAPYGAPHETYPGHHPRPSPELAMLGQVMDRMMSRLDSFEAKLAGPGAAPAQAPDQIAGVLQTLKLAQQIQDMMGGGYEDEDEDEEPGWQPKNPQEALMAVALKKLDEDPDALDALLGKNKQPAAARPGPGPRLVRANDAPAAAAPAQAPAAQLDPAQILAQLQQLDPASRAELVNQIGQSLDPETLAALGQLMGGESAAG